MPDSWNAYNHIKTGYFALHDDFSVNSMPEVRESAGLAFSTLYKVLIVFGSVFWFSFQFFVQLNYIMKIDP